MKTVKTDVNVPSKRNKQKKMLKIFLVDILSSTDEKTGSGAGSGSVSQWYGSADPDPYQNITDTQN
jgi:hypothetical protein